MIDVLPGFREFYPEDCFFRNYLFDQVRRCCQNFGFCEYDSPILEPLELYTGKSGEEIVTQLFHFEDRGNRKVAMRPEITPAVARMIGTKINTLKHPIKWFSLEENFRYERPQKGRLRSFYQFNFDIFGENSIYAEIEIITLALSIFQSLGLTSQEIHVRLSDRQIWNLILEIFEVQNPTEVLSLIDKIEKNPKVIDTIENSCKQGKFLAETVLFLQKIRLIEELTDHFQKLNLNEQQQSLFAERIQQIKDLMSYLSFMNLENFITIDFGIVRGLAYYTGFVFEIFGKIGEKSRALAGGGRYDNLIEKFGYTPTPAVGMAIGDVTLGNILREKNLFPEYNPQTSVYILFDDSVTNRMKALQCAYELRKNGISVNFSLKENLSLNKQFKQSSGSQFLVIFQKEEIFLKNTVSHSEKQIKFEAIVPEIKNIIKP